MRGSSEDPDAASRRLGGLPRPPGRPSGGRRWILVSGPRRVLLGGLVAWLAVAVGLRAAVALPEHCPPVEAADARVTARRAVGWFATHQQADGRWTYRYEPATDQDLGGYEIVS